MNPKEANQIRNAIDRAAQSMVEQNTNGPIAAYRTALTEAPALVAIQQHSRKIERAEKSLIRDQPFDRARLESALGNEANGRYDACDGPPQIVMSASFTPQEGSAGGKESLALEKTSEIDRQRWFEAEVDSRFRHLPGGFSTRQHEAVQRLTLDAFARTEVCSDILKKSLHNTAASLRKDPSRRNSDSHRSRQSSCLRKRAPLASATHNSDHRVLWITESLAQISDKDKSAYQEAVSTASNLVMTESPPDRFLRCHEDDLLLSARRLCKYWTLRRESFGKKVFLPMSQTGDGTLDRRDIAVLGSSFLSLLPNDSEGRPVVCCDGSKLKKPSCGCMLRCMFYVHSVVAVNDKSRNQGLTLLFIMSDPEIDGINKECLEKVWEALPVRVSMAHIFCRDPELLSLQEQQSFSALHQFFSSQAKEPPLRHCIKSRAETREVMMRFGILRQGLPKSLGGDWGLEKFLEWQESRTRLEWGLPSDRHKRSLSGLTEEERIERKRRMNVVHSRRNRERERIQIEILQEQRTELGEEQDLLRQENERLTNLLGSANEIVGTLGHGNIN